MQFLDINSAGFSTRSAEVLKARTECWCARTPYGLAVLRHRDVGQLLRDRRLRQGSHAWPDLQGLTGSFAAFWKRSIISHEGATHQALRRPAMRALSPDFIETLIPEFRAAAVELTDAMTGTGCEFITEFSEPFAGRAITTLLALEPDMAPEIAHDASRLGLAMAIGSQKDEAIFDAATERLSALAERLIDRARRGLDRHGFVARLVAAFNASDTADQQALVDMIVIAIFGGVDTTRAQLGFAITLFIDHPGEWQKLRADHGLIPAAIEEVIRTRPTTTWATREATETFVHNGVTITKGDILHMFVHASALDDDAAKPPEFDISARRKVHFGFGGGAHHCLGQHVARTDMAAALRVLATRWAEVNWNGVPEWLPDSGNTSPVCLPIRFTEG